MNVTELSRRVHIPTQQLREILPELGFDIGMRAIKVDDRVAQRIIEQLNRPDVRTKFLEKSKDDETEEKVEDEKEQVAQTGTLIIPAQITVKEFAAKLEMPVTKVIVELIKQGVMAAQNQFIDYETAAIIAGDLGKTVDSQSEEEDTSAQSDIESKRADHLEKLLQQDESKELEPRPPVVVIMGHVDHGKTTLLDAIRETNVTEQEKGGITQHIGAYQVTVTQEEKDSSSEKILRPQSSDAAQQASSSAEASADRRDDFTLAERKITFIDTPGHEAFTAMRSRGARVADIAILIVAADDGVKPQTVEALTLIQRAELPFIVAINKIDKAGANPEKVKQELGQLNVMAEDWGGKTPFVEISAKQGTNISGILDLVLLLSEMEKENIQANPDRNAVGTIIESHVDKGEGPVATVLVQTGTLRVGDLVSVGQAHGKLKAMKDFHGASVDEALPSMPVRILGLKSLPSVGDILEVSLDPENFKQILRDAKFKKRPIRIGSEPQAVSSVKAKGEEEEEEEEDKQPYVRIILRADVLGSIEAIIEALEAVKHEEVNIEVIQQGLGTITETEVLSAEATGALVLGFNTTATPAAYELAKDKGVSVKTFTVIYDLVDEVKKEVEKLLSPEITETQTGVMEVIAIFRQEKSSSIVGCRVQEGKIAAGHLCRLKRSNKVKSEGKIGSVQIGQQVVKEVTQGQECGVKLEMKSNIKEGDIIEAYTETKKERKLE